MSETLEEQYQGYQAQIERWIQDLRDAGWIQIRTTEWRAPNGAVYRGPYGAWKWMKQGLGREER